MGRLNKSAYQYRDEADAALHHAHKLVFKYKGYRRATAYLNQKLAFLQKRFTKKIHAFLETAEEYKRLQTRSDNFAWQEDNE